MPTAAITMSASALTPSLFRQPTTTASRTAPLRLSRPLAGVTAPRRCLSCHATLTADVFASSSPEAAGKIGARILVKAPVKVYHVLKASELKLCGMEGVIKQCVSFWKGKRVSANLPFKVEFLLPVDGQEKAIKFFAHLREEEFNFLQSSSNSSA